MLITAFPGGGGGGAEVLNVTLNNSETYPFNNSKQSVKFAKPKKSTDYAVTTEATSVTGGAVGDIEITEKTTEGFDLHYTGSATQVTVRCIIHGR